MSKRVLAFFLIVFTLSFSMVYAGGVDTYYAKVNNSVSEEFNNFQIEDKTGEAYVMGMGGAYGNVLCLYADNKDASAALNFASEFNAEAFVISFDTRVETESSISYLELSMDKKDGSGTETQKTVVLSNNGQIGYYQPDGATISYSNKAYQKDKWYHFDLWFDLSSDKAVYYVDGELLGKIDISTDIDRVTKLIYLTIYKNSTNRMYVDNVNINNLLKLGGKVNVDAIMGVPEYVEKSTFVNLRSNTLGNIFFNKSDIKFGFHLKNAIGLDRNYNVDVVVKNENGCVDFSKTYTLAASAYAEKTEEININVSKYGFYYLTVNVTDMLGGEVVSSDTEFSVANGPKDGALNEKQAMNVHMLGGSSKSIFIRYVEDKENPEPFIELMAKAGYKNLRDEYLWNQIEQTKGEFEFTPLQENIIEASMRHNFGLYLILGYKSYLYNNEEYPKTESELAHWRDYVTWTVSNLKGKVTNFEMWNEWNLQYWEKGAPAEDYVKLMKVTYEALKEANPEAKLYGIALGPRNNEGDYIREIMEAGAGKYMDAVSIHPYHPTGEPEKNGLLDNIEKIRGILREYGYGDIEIISTELGWPSTEKYFNDEDTMANYTVQASAVTHESLAQIYWYTLVEKQTGNNAEDSFGFIRSWSGTNVPFSAKPVFLAMAFWNNLMANAKSDGHISICKDNVTVYKFKLRNGQNAYALWTHKGKESVSIKVNTDGVMFYDLYGNDTKLDSKDGIVSLSLDERVSYIVGNFDEVEEVKTEYIINDNKDIVTVANDEFDVVVKQTNEEDVCVDVSASDNIEVLEITKRDAKNSIVRLKAKAEVSDKDYVCVKIFNSDKSKIYYSEILSISCLESLTVNFSVQYFKDMRWRGVLNLTNNKMSNEISGRFEFNEPEILKNTIGSIEIGSILPKDSKVVKFNIPESLQKLDRVDIAGVLKLNDGEEIPVSEFSYYATLMPIKETTIDGQISSSEYNMSAPMKINRESQVVMLDNNKWLGTSDLSGVMYMNYDEEFFYLAAEIEDDVLGDKETPDRVWAADSIQFAFAGTRDNSAAITEIGIGLSEGKPSVYRYSYMGGKKYDDIIGATDHLQSLSDKNKIAIERRGTKTVYELKMSWEDIYGEEEKFDKKEVYYSTLINDNDGKGRKGWLEFCPGIGEAKSAILFSKVPVQKAGVNSVN